MKIVRACLVLLALCPAWSFAVDAGPEDNPYVEGIQCNGNVATSCESHPDAGRHNRRQGAG